MKRQRHTPTERARDERDALNRVRESQLSQADQSAPVVSDDAHDPHADQVTQ